MKILLFLLLSVPLFALAQDAKFPIDPETKRATYEEVIDQQGTKDVLYDKALDMFATKFRSANDVIQIKDKDAGKIIGKWNILPVDQRSGYVSCSIIILVKDNKYKYQITDILYLGTNEFKPWRIEDEPGIWTANMTKGGQRKIKNGTSDAILSFIADLKTAMAKKSISDF